MPKTCVCTNTHTLKANPNVHIPILSGYSSPSLRSPCLTGKQTNKQTANFIILSKVVN